MNIKYLRQSGFHVIEIVVIIAVVGLVGVVGWVFFAGKANTPSDSKVASTDYKNHKQATPSFIEWSFDGNAWKAMGSAPTCEDPLTIGAPIDVTKATAILYPGQIRGGDFKPHGGIGMDNGNDNSLTVSAIRDAYLYRGTRYIEGGETQYLFDFMDSCGVMYRMDHLATLSPAFAQYANKLPEAKVDNSRTTMFNEHPLIKKGTVIATEVGMKNNKNAFFDLGVYDLRKQNEASKTDIYKTDQKRISDKEQSFYAVCWFNLLPAKDKSVVKALPSRDQAQGATSDYCK